MQDIYQRAITEAKADLARRKEQREKRESIVLALTNAEVTQFTRARIAEIEAEWPAFSRGLNPDGVIDRRRFVQP